MHCIATQPRILGSDIVRLLQAIVVQREVYRITTNSRARTHIHVDTNMHTTKHTYITTCRPCVRDEAGTQHELHYQAHWLKQYTLTDPPSPFTATEMKVLALVLTFFCVANAAQCDSNECDASAEDEVSLLQTGIHMKSEDDFQGEDDDDDDAALQEEEESTKKRRRRRRR